MKPKKYEVTFKIKKKGSYTVEVESYTPEGATRTATKQALLEIGNVWYAQTTNRIA
jgi:hypothetical protein